MKNYIIRLSFATAFVLLLSACKKNTDYISGGTISNAQVNMTTYDYLKGNSWALFDTLILLVDKAGIKDIINQEGVSFFAPTDYCIKNYMAVRSAEGQKVDPAYLYTLDTLIKYDLDKFRDSMQMYFVHDELTFDKLTEDGEIKATMLTGAQAVVSFESTRNINDGYNSNSSSVPRLQYFTYLFQPLEPPFKAKNIPSEVGSHTVCQTSGILTTNGLLNVLSNSHTLFFHRMP